MKRVLITAIVLSIAVVSLGAWKAGRILAMGTGYIAKTLCSEYFLAGREDPQQIWSDILDMESLFEWGRFELDRDRRRVSAWIGPGLVETTAVYRDGLGCTIAAGIDPDELRPLPRIVRVSSVPLPAATRPVPHLETLLDEAFSEPSANSHRQTRAVVVLHNGEIVAERYAQPFNAHTPLIGWSMTKSITNTLIGMLVGDGLLDLDAPAPVPEWRSASDPRRHITLRHLLQMSSGLDFQEVYEPDSDATNMLFTVPSAAAYAAAAPLAHEPGSHWYYSSGTTNILGRIFRDLVGGNEAAVHDFVRSRLFEPLGLGSMVIEPDATGAPVGSSFSYATARDWARLGQFWLQDGVWNGRRLLPEGWMHWSSSPAPAADGGEYGAQFWLNTGQGGENRAFPNLPTSMYFAHGFNRQIVAVFPEQRVVVVRLGFTTDDSWDDNEFLSGVLDALGH